MVLEGVRKTYRARYYNPTTGRFLSEDPIGFRGGINKYAYVGDDPIDLIDPFGLDKKKKCLGDAAKKEGIAFGTDVLGAIPGEGQALAIAQLAAGGVGFVNSLANNDAAGAVGSIVGDQTIMVGMAAKSMGVTALKVVPVAGNVLSGFMALRDVYNGYQDYQSCMGGS